MLNSFEFVSHTANCPTQALWLHQGFRLEFLGISSFVPGLFLAGLFFYAVNCWILGILVEDVGGLSAQEQVAK